MANTYNEELMRWARAGGYGAMPMPAQRHSGSVAEQRRPRRDHLTERILYETKYHLEEMADRSRPLPADIPLESLINFLTQAMMYEHFNRTEGPGWENDPKFQTQMRGRY